jgi:CO/xanthine dehydrogenase FAD-binding subunit
MRGSAATMTVLTPRTPKEALALYSAEPKALPLAGGTDLMVGWNMGLLNGKTVLDLSRLDAWKSVKTTREGLSAGCLVTHAGLRRHPLVRKHFPLLSDACATVGAAQIQNRGTIGGNLANASPAADTFPPLAVYEASVRLAGPQGIRELPVLELFAGVKKTHLRPGELIASVELPFPERKPSAALFRKVGTRLAQAISKTMFAGLLWVGRDGAVEEARLSFGSLAPTVRRLRASEAFLKGRPLDAKTVAEAVELLAADVSPIDDIRSTREYRLAASRNILRRFLEGAAR